MVAARAAEGEAVGKVAAVQVVATRVAKVAVLVMEAVKAVGGRVKKMEALKAAVSMVVVMAVVTMAAVKVGTCSARRNHRSQSHTRTVPLPHAPRSANPQHRPGKRHCMLGCMYLSTTRAAEEWLVVALAAVKEVAREDTYSAVHSQCSPHQDGIALERCRGR